MKFALVIEWPLIIVWIFYLRFGPFWWENPPSLQNIHKIWSWGFTPKKNSWLEKAIPGRYLIRFEVLPRFDLGFVWGYVSLSTMVNHHFSPPFGNIVLELYQASRSRKSKRVKIHSGFFRGKMTWDFWRIRKYQAWESSILRLLGVQTHTSKALGYDVAGFSKGIHRDDLRSLNGEIFVRCFDQVDLATLSLLKLYWMHSTPKMICKGSLCQDFWGWWNMIPNSCAPCMV